MKLLVLGGTRFVGRAVVDSALARGHEVTLFNRGRTNPELFPEVERLRGDRVDDLAALRGRSFEAVVDPSGFTPKAVRASVAALPGAHYLFVSSISAYADLSVPPTEESPTYTAGDGYGELKAAAEREVPAGGLIVRPGLIVGPNDPTYRFTYWVERIARGGDVLAPEPREAPVQLIDVRDLGGWLVRSAEDRLAGTFNAVGPAEPLTMERLLERIRAVSRSDVRFRWVAAEYLRQRGIEEWSKLPLWLVDPAYRGMQQAVNSRALAAGLELRPLEETVHDTLVWIRSGEPTFLGDARPGLEPQQETELLAEAA
jgi:2'-hydroxyisoflavone reductase